PHRGERFGRHRRVGGDGEDLDRGRWADRARAGHRFGASAAPLTGASAKTGRRFEARGAAHLMATIWPFRHLGLKALSLVLALLLWMIVSGEETVERGLRVPLELQQVPAGLELTGE